MKNEQVTHYVYEFYAEDGTCLYVGCTNGLGLRLQSHTNAASFWPEVTRIEASAYPDKVTGRQAEKDRIRLLDPTYNLAFTDRMPHTGAAISAGMKKRADSVRRYTTAEVMEICSRETDHP